MAYRPPRQSETRDAKRRRRANLPRNVRDALIQVAKSDRLAGDVTVTHAQRCECGAWMRPGRDHYCTPP